MCTVNCSCARCEADKTLAAAGYATDVKAELARWDGYLPGTNRGAMLQAGRRTAEPISATVAQLESDETLAAAGYATGRLRSLKQPAHDPTDSQLLERLRWHQACPQLAHPGYRLRLAVIASVQSNGARLKAASERSPEVEKKTLGLLERVVVRKLDENELRELDRWWQRKSPDDEFAALGVIAPLLVSDRIDAAFAAQSERIPSAKLALGFKQANSDEAIAESLRFLDGIGLAVEDDERREIEEALWEQSFAADDPLGHAVRYSANRIVAARIAALIEKAKQNESPAIPSAQLAAHKLRLDAIEQSIEGHQLRLAQDAKTQREAVLAREAAAWKRACPWIFQ